jgi:hypothetical protein
MIPRSKPVKLINGRIINNLVYYNNAKQAPVQQCETSTGTAVYSKFKAITGTPRIKAKADNIKYQDYL